jgi:hypothetical protein
MPQAARERYLRAGGWPAGNFGFDLSASFSS